MKKIIFSLLLIFTSYSYANENKIFSYMDTHAMGGYPMVGFGSRYQGGIHGFDISMNTCVLRPPFSLEIFQLRGLYLVYPKEKGLYLGAGMGLVNEKELLDHVSASIEGSLGYQWNNNLFLEVTATAPLAKTSAVKVWPGLTIGYGF